MAREHKLSALVYWGQRKRKDVSKALQEDYRKTLHRSIQMDECRRRVEEALERGEIPYALLKGCVLRNCYPLPELRTMTDLDILVRTEDYEKITKAFLSLGAKGEGRDGNHLNFRFPGAVLVECHPNLVDPSAPYGKALNPGWQYCRPTGEGSCWELSEEGVYLHTLCHLAEHFVSGGVGVRFVLDLWLLKQKTDLDTTRLKEALSALALLDFAKNIEALGDYWFGAGSGEGLSELEDYILSSGSHGFAQRATLNAASLQGSFKKATLKKMLYTRQGLENRYPWSKKSVLLLPFAWCARTAFVLKNRREKVKNWQAGIKQHSKEEITAQREKLIRFGLDPHK